MKILMTRFVAVGVVVFGKTGWNLGARGADMRVVVPTPAALIGPNLTGYPYVPMAGRGNIDPRIAAAVKNPHLDDGIYMGGPPVSPGNGGGVTVPGSGPVEWKGEVGPHPEIFHPGPNVMITPIVPPAHPEIFQPGPNVYMAPLLPAAPRPVQATQPGRGILKK